MPTRLCGKLVGIISSVSRDGRRDMQPIAGWSCAVLLVDLQHMLWRCEKIGIRGEYVECQGAMQDRIAQLVICSFISIHGPCSTTVPHAKPGV